MLSYNKLLLVFLSLFLFFALSAFADDDYFTTLNLQVTGQPIDYTVVDLNNDGFNDLLVSHVQTKEEKRVRCFSIFYQGETGYSSSADQSFAVDDDAIIFDVADVAQATGMEIVFFKSI